MSLRTDVLLAIADDELVLGWRNSEWTGIAPFLEEDVAFSSIAQNEIGHARALYELAARELGTTADELAFDRPPEEYRSAPLVELRKLEWARTFARHWLYETADAVRIEAHRVPRSSRQSVRGGRATAQDGSAPHGWSMKKTHSPFGRRRMTSMPWWCTSMGVPSNRDGSYSHCETASIAARSSAGTDRNTRRSLTRPCRSMTASSMTIPVVRPICASRG